MNILKLTPSEFDSHYDSLKSIFEETLPNPGMSEELKGKLRSKYLDQYRDKIFFIAKEDDVLGYICGDIETDTDRYHNVFEFLKDFQSDLKDYPAHLHINLSSKARGKGLGSILIKEFEDCIRNFGITGVHLHTGATARNRNFYAKNNYLEIAVGTQYSQVVMLGKSL